MSEEFTRCVRGCNTRCYADECLTIGWHDHDPIPRRSEVGLLCRPCADRILHALADIELTYPDLDIHMSQRGQTEGKRGKVSGSPALIRLDVLAMLDYRSKVGDGVRSVLGTLDGWAQCAHDDMGVTMPATNLSSVLSFLTNLHPRICEQPWIDDYFDEVTELAAMLRRATDQPKPIGRCFGFIANKPCNRPLYEPVPPEVDIVCPDENCGRTYTGAELIKLQIQSERDMNIRLERGEAS